MATKETRIAAPDPKPDPTPDPTSDMSAYVENPDAPVSMGDVAALNGVSVAPDASTVDTVKAEDVFISEGMRNDLEHYGWAVDPVTGKKITKE